MVSKVLWIVSFPRCTAGPKIVSLVWIGNRLLILKEGQHLTRAWLTPKRTISWIPNKEAHNPTSRSKIFGESRFPGSCKISYPDKKSCIFPNPAQYFGQFPDSGNTVQTLFGCWWLISVSAHKWQVLWCFCFTVHFPSRLLFGAMLFKTFFLRVTSKIFSVCRQSLNTLRNPWLTTGLLKSRSIKTKSRLYQLFLK